MNDAEQPVMDLVQCALCRNYLIDPESAEDFFHDYLAPLASQPPARSFLFLPCVSRVFSRVGMSEKMHRYLRLTEQMKALLAPLGAVGRLSGAGGLLSFYPDRPPMEQLEPAPNALITFRN